ncbi:cilia- and flagella-associated protein 57-like [Clinocottus analis]|uniref:cilia- and flagella-associated protein 57-like n=1 Tax=Clinocottus analis TaxID=304258 RepID=UPI0035BF0D37
MSSTMETELGHKKRLRLEQKYNRRLAERISRAECNKKDKDIDRLQKENVSLEEKIKAALETITELKEQVKEVAESKRDEALDWKKRWAIQEKEHCQLVKENTTLKAKHQTELQKISNICKKEMAEQTATHQSEVSKAKAVKKTLQGQVLALQKQQLVDKDSQADVQASLNAAEEESQCLNKRLEGVMLQKEELEKSITRKDNLAQANYTKYCILKSKYQKLKSRTAEIETMDAVKENLAALEQTVAEQKKFIKNQKKEIAGLKNNINQNEEQLERKEKELAILNLELRNELRKGLEEKLKESETKCKMETEALKKVDKENAVLSKKVSGHTSLVEAYKFEQRKDKEKIRALETQQQQTKKDLHGCFQLISDPFLFKKKLIAYYRRYLDGDTTVLVHEEDIATEAGIKKAAQAYHTRVMMDHFNERDENKKMLKKKQQEDNRMSQNIDIINAQRRQIKTLEEQTKPPKPVRQKVQSSRFPTIVREVLEARQYDSCLRISGVPEAIPEEDVLPEPSPSELSCRRINILVKPYVPPDDLTDVTQP